MPTKSVASLIERYKKDEDFKVNFEKESQRLEIAILLKNLREANHLTQKELAEKAGKPQSTIARIENGSINVTVNLLHEIAESVGKELEITFK